MRPTRSPFVTPNCGERGGIALCRCVDLSVGGDLGAAPDEGPVCAGLAPARARTSRTTSSSTGSLRDPRVSSSRPALRGPGSFVTGPGASKTTAQHRAR